MTKLGFKLKSSNPTGSLYSAKKLPVHGISNIADWGVKVVYIAGKSTLISIVFCWAPNRGTKWQNVFHTNRGNCQSTNSVFYSPGAQWSFVDWGSRVKSLSRFFWWVAEWRNRLPVTIGELPTTLGIQFVCIEFFSIQKSSTLGPLVKIIYPAIYWVFTVFQNCTRPFKCFILFSLQTMQWDYYCCLHLTHGTWAEPRSGSGSQALNHKVAILPFVLHTGIF